MADADISASVLGELLERIRIEHIGYNAKIAVIIDHTAPIDRDSAADLPPVLQGIQCKIGQMNSIELIFIINSEYAAFLMGLVKHRNSSRMG